MGMFLFKLQSALSFPSHKGSRANQKPLRETQLPPAIFKAISFRQFLQKQMEIQGVGGSLGNNIKINDHNNYFYFFNGKSFDNSGFQFIAFNNDKITQGEVLDFVFNLNNKLGNMENLLLNVSLNPSKSRNYCYLSILFMILVVVLLGITSPMQKLKHHLVF